MMNAISTVVFDLGRVLVNIDFDAFPNALELQTPESRDPYRSDVAKVGRLYETGKISTKEYLDRMFDVFNKKFSREFLLFAYNEIIRDDVPGMMGIIELVQKRYTTAMLSNTSASHFEKAERECETVRKITRRFLSFEIGVAKPAPEIYRHVISELDVEPARILFIDDLQENIDGALDAGMNGLLFAGVEKLKIDLTHLNIFPS